MHVKSKSAIIVELVKGKETAIRLQNLLLKPPPPPPPPPADHHHVSAQDLALQILTSFTHTLSVLTTSRRAAASSAAAGKSKAAGISRDRRGCYKRRRSSDSRVTISPVTGDSYAWRKYGQKIILNSEYPRCYFRCTNKYDRGCKATKQVQIIQENPILYQTTYFNRHTCSSSTDDDHAPITATRAPPPTVVSGSGPHVEPPNLLLRFPSRQDHDHDQHPTNPITELDIINNSVSEIERSLQDQWLDFTGPEYKPNRAPLTGSYQEEGIHSIDMDVYNEFGDIDNFHLDQIF